MDQAAAAADLKFYTIKASNEVVKAGDTVVYISQEDDDEHVGIVKSIKAHVDGNVMAELRLYYHPEDTVCGRKPFHGSRELFLTDDFDTLSVFSIRRKCIVYTFVDYMRFTMGTRPHPHNYFCRFEYNTSTAWFYPDSVEVFCKCQLPFNPDVFTLECQVCRDWYHPECIDMTIDHPEWILKFTCSSCQSIIDSKRRNVTFPDPSMVESKQTKC